MSINIQITRDGGATVVSKTVENMAEVEQLRFQGNVVTIVGDEAANGEAAAQKNAALPKQTEAEIQAKPKDMRTPSGPTPSTKR